MLHWCLFVCLNTDDSSSEEEDEENEDAAVERDPEPDFTEVRFVPEDATARKLQSAVNDGYRLI